MVASGFASDDSLAIFLSSCPRYKLWVVEGICSLELLCFDDPDEFRERL
jgi:hypothetical protein